MVAMSRSEWGNHSIAIRAGALMKKGCARAAMLCPTKSTTKLPLLPPYVTPRTAYSSVGAKTES